MQLKIWTERQMPLVYQLEAEGRIPVDVTHETKRVLSILDDYYGKDRDVDNDDGGYVVIFTECMDDDREIQEILAKYHVRLNEEEYRDDLCICGGVTWTSALYLTSNDYGITVIYPLGGGME